MITTAIGSSYVHEFTFAGISGRCPMRARGTINGQPWAYRLDEQREAITVNGVEIVSVEFPPDLGLDGFGDCSSLVSDQIEFIVQRLMEWAAQ